MSSAPAGPMRIVVLNWRDSSHPEAGGAELYCAHIAREFAGKGHQVRFVTSRPPGAPRSESIDGYEIIRRGGRFTVYLAVLGWLLLHRGSIDGVIDSQNGIPFFAPLAVRRTTAVVLLMHHVHQEQFALYFPAPMAAVGRWLESSAARRVYGIRAIAAVSPSTQAAVRTRLRLRGPIRLAPCGLSPVTGTVRCRSATPRIVTVGRLVPHKQVRLLIGAMQEICETVPSLELHLVGDGPERVPLEALVAAHGLDDRITFHGKVDDQQRDELIASAWLTVNTTRGEGWGLSIMEANQHGVPAVAFRVEGMRDSVLDGRTGWLVDDPVDLGAVVRAALKELSDPAESRRRESATKSWAGGFTWPNAADQLLTIMAQEQRRLDRRQDRRSRQSDLAIIVDIPKSAVPVGWVPRLRVGDLVRRDVDAVRLLLYGVDDGDVPALLARIGVRTLTGGSEPVRVSVASRREVLLMTAGVRWHDSTTEGIRT